MQLSRLTALANHVPLSINIQSSPPYCHIGTLAHRHIASHLVACEPPCCMLVSRTFRVSDRACIPSDALTASGGTQRMHSVGRTDCVPSDAEDARNLNRMLKNGLVLRCYYLTFGAVSQSNQPKRSECSASYHLASNYSSNIGRAG